VAATTAAALRDDKKAEVLQGEVVEVVVEIVEAHLGGADVRHPAEVHHGDGHLHDTAAAVEAEMAEVATPIAFLRRDIGLREYLSQPCRSLQRCARHL